MADTAPAAAPMVPFTIASHLNSRQAFQTTAALNASAPVTPSGTPVQLNAVGFPTCLRLEVTATISGGTPTFLADAPFNVIQQIQLKNAGGQNLLYNMDGYALMVLNKFGGTSAGLAYPVGETADPRSGRQYSANAASGFHFFLDVPFDIDRSSGLCAIPALAANRAYTLEITFNSISGIFSATTPPTTVNVTVDASVIYWDAPLAETPGKITQGTAPWGIDLNTDKVTSSLWLSEFPNVQPGTQFPRVVNVGNIIRNFIFIARTAAGARTDADWPAIFEQYVDGFLRLRLKKTEWQDAMSRWYNYTASAFDVAGGLETGVYVLPYHVFAGGKPGDPTNSRAQLMWTEDSTLVQHKFMDFGASIGRLQLLTQQISAPNVGWVYNQ